MAVAEKINKDYYVYSGAYGGKIVYVGKGVKERCLHLNSGISHLYEANKLHFLGEQIDIKIELEGLTSEQALEEEKRLIIDWQPLWNGNDNPRRVWVDLIRRSARYIRTLETVPWSLRLLCAVDDNLSGDENIFISRASLRNCEISKNVEMRYFRNDWWEPRVPFLTEFVYHKKESGYYAKINIDYILEGEEMKKWVTRSRGARVVTLPQNSTNTGYC